MPTPEPNDATPFLPERRSLTALRSAASDCRGCHLWRVATQTVFGEGRKGARVMLVGEQPGDKEDRAGEPFVGPAGRELDRGLDAAGIDRAEAYALVLLGATAAKALLGSSLGHAAPRRAARFGARPDRHGHNPPVRDPAWPGRRFPRALAAA